MIRNLQVAFKEMLTEETWLTEHTKMKAKEKVFQLINDDRFKDNNNNYINNLIDRLTL